MGKIKEGETRKALFLQRLGAFVIDMILVSFIAALISAPFINSDKLTKLEVESKEIISGYVDGKMKSSDYMTQYSNVYYKISKVSGITTLVTVLLEVLYFVVYQLYNKGQTLGKKIMKIRVISKDGDLTMNQMIFRAFIADSILLNIVNFGFMIFSGRDIYLYGSMTTSMVQYVVFIVSVIMIINKNNGCAVHDKLMHTEVIRED